MSDLIRIRLPAPPTYEGDPEDWAERLNRYLHDVTQTYNGLFNRGIRWQNLRSELISHTFNATPDTADTITHNLGKIPEFYIVTVESTTAPASAMVYYTSTDKTNWTNEDIVLRCNVASVITTLLVM